MERKTLRYLRKKKERGEKITMISTYDYISAKLCESAGIDSILVGDSLGMVFQGLDSTLPVTLEEMIYHAKAVRRGAPDTFLIVDMPFMSYQDSPESALRNCGRVLKETGAQAVKLEGGEEIADIVERLTSFGIPVVGHLGFTPQFIHRFGGPKVVGREEGEAQKLRKDFKAVFHDLVGLYEEVKPKFVRRYVEGARIFREALIKFKIDVERGNFPSEEESYGA